MSRYEVEISSRFTTNIEADSEQDAIQKAMENPENAETLLERAEATAEETE
jgi:hypothetical protein